MAAKDRNLNLAGLIAASLSQFELIFDRSRPARDPTLFAALAGGNNVPAVERIAKAIAHAREGGWLHKLMEQVLLDEATEQDPRLLDEVVRQKIVKKGSTLESIADASRGFGAAGIELQRLSRAIRQVCRIDIDGRAAGTGFLVRPDMVLTAYHVVEPLTRFEDPQDPASKVGAKPESAKRMRIWFDDIDVMRNGYRERLTGFSVDPHDDWLKEASPCHKLELIDLFPEDYCELAGKLDYALIRLKGIARPGLLPAEIRGAPKVKARDWISILQHPDGKALSIDRAKVIGLCGEWRIEHDVNSRPGTSGSPCFDRDFQVVALHQAGRGDEAKGKKNHNRAVPLATVHPLIASLPPPDPWLVPMADLTEGDPGHPVIGRLETQEWAWKQLQAEVRATDSPGKAPAGEARKAKPILILTGATGVGKSFTFDILRSLLPRVGHDIVRLGAREDIQAAQPEGFASVLLERLGYPPMNLPVDDSNTERPRWLKAEHLPALIGALDQGRGKEGRGVWIVIDDIDKAAIGSSTEISDYLFSFYAEASRRDWLRIVLLGYTGMIPEELRDHAVRHQLAPPTLSEMASYLLAKLPAEMDFERREGAIKATVQMIADDFDTFDEAQLMRVVQRKLARAVEYWLDQ